uniref:Uncharacterized protein n=1 Tax=Anopheles minimus TaxID=112268 RepID=A0A182W8V6_9DIPT
MADIVIVSVQNKGARSVIGLTSNRSLHETIVTSGPTEKVGQVTTRAPRKLPGTALMFVGCMPRRIEYTDNVVREERQPPGRAKLGFFPVRSGGSRKFDDGGFFNPSMGTGWIHNQFHCKAAEAKDNTTDEFVCPLDIVQT